MGSLVSKASARLRVLWSFAFVPVVLGVIFFLGEGWKLGLWVFLSLSVIALLLCMGVEEADLQTRTAVEKQNETGDK